MKQQLFTTGDAVSAACAVSTKRRGRLLAMAAGILSVLILLVTAMQFVILAGADRYSEYSDDCRKFMMDYMKKSSSYDTLVNKTYSPYRNYVESLGRDTLFQADLVAWKIATFDLKNGATQVTNSKEYKYYLGILMDLLSECTQDKDFLGKVKDVSDASHVSTVKAVMNFDEKYNNLYMKLNPSEADEIKNVLSEISSIQSFLGTVSNFKDLIEQAKNLDDLLYKLSQAQVIYDLMTGYGDTMQDMYNRCDDNNPALKAALLTVRDLCNQSMSKVNMVTLFAGGTVAEEGLKVALGAVQKEIVNAMGLTGAAITLAQSAGKMYANALFGTEDMLAAYYQMDALYDIENLVRLSLAWANDADSFFSAFSLYENIMYKGVTYSEKYMKAIYEDSVVGVLFAWASGRDKEYEEFKNNMTSLKLDTYASFSSLQKSAYNAFINSKYTSDISSYFTVTDLYTLPSDEEIKQNDGEIERLSIQACGLPDEDYTLNDDLTISNNLYHSNGTIDLNGHTLTINGDLILEGGSINVDGGELIIKGDYNAYNSTTDADGTITYNDGGFLVTSNVNDKVTVYGNFNTYANYNGEYWDCLYYGEIEIKGNLNDYYYYDENDEYIEGGLYSNGTKFIFSGTEKQTITATDGYIYFKNVEFVNKDTTGSIEFDNTSISCCIEKDQTVNGNLDISGMDLNGHKLTVNGNLKLWDRLSLGGGELYIKGNYDAYIPVKNTNGTTSYTGGYLCMNNVNDKVTVDGDFNTYCDYQEGSLLSHGTIEIKGNLKDYYSDSNGRYIEGGLYSRGTKFIFSGKGKQTINATDGYIYFQKVDFVDTKNREIVVNCEIYIELCRDTYITGDNATVSGNLNGYALNVSKNLTVNDTLDIQGGCLNVKGDLYNYGEINLGSGSLIVNGNYNAYKSTSDTDGTVTYSNGGYLHMGNINDKVTVDGDFNTYYDYEGSGLLGFGTIEIKGDLNDYTNYDGYFYGLYSEGTKFIFSGTGKQTITAKDGYIKFENVEFVNKDTTGSIEFDNTKISCHIEKDETVTTENLDISSMSLNGHKLTVNGNLKLWSDLSLGGGELYITGNYDAYIPVKNADGTTSYFGGYLYTSNINDKVTVDGDFNTYYDYEGSGLLGFGTIEIKGDLNDYTNYDGYFYGLYSEGTKFIFSGTGKQTITAKDGYIKFENVEFVNKDTTGSIEFDNTKMSCHIEKDETVTGNLCIEDIDINCHKLTVNGDLKLWNRLLLGGGELYITGNYDAYIPVKNADGTTSYTGGYLSMKNAVDKVTVDGDFNTYYDYESSSKLELGTIEIKGDLNDYTNYDGYFYGLYSEGTKFIFSGTGTQTITALDGKLVLNTAEFVNKNVQIDCSTEIDVDVPVKVHDYSDEWTVDVEAACNDGSKSHHCTRCDAKTDITVIPATGKHSFGDWKITKAATCTATGTKTRTCSVCKKVETQTIEALGHTEVTDKAVAATCTKTGLTEGIHCSVCDAVIKAQEVIPAKGHTEVIDKAVAATCTKTGLTEGIHCSVCDAVIKAQETVPATGKHSFGNWKITKAATCTATGTKTRTCSVCGKVETQTIAKTAHKYVNTVVKPTYTAQGYTLHKCSVCGTSYKDTYTAKLTLAKVTGVKLGGRAADALRVNWTKNANASGYIVEMYQGNKWVRVAKITSNATTTYRASGLKASTVYKFRVRAYKMSGKTAVYSAYSTELAARTNPSVMTGAKLGGRAADALRINWTKNASADGYIVEMYQGNKWVRVAKITSNSTTTFRKAGLKASSVYKFRVMAYKMSGKTALYGNYGSVSGKTAAK